MKVVVIDDVSSVRLMLGAVANSLSYEVTEVDSADKILSTIEKVKPDIVFLDINMQETNGLDFVPEILKIHNTNIIVCSGVADYNVLRRALVLGAKDYIVKPINISRVKTAMYKVVNNCEMKI